MEQKTISRFTWASRVLGLAAIFAGIIAAAKWLPASVQQWAALATALIMGAARWCEQQIPAKTASAVKTGVATLLVVLLALTAAVSCNPYRAGWIAVASATDARDATDDGLATAFRGKIAECGKAHGTGSESFQKCVESSNEYKAVAKWRMVVFPAVTNAIRAGKATLEIAERVGASKDSTLKKVISALKVAACTLIQSINDWSSLLGSKATVALQYLNMVDNLVCEGEK